MRIIDYIVIGETDHLDLTERVCELMKRGWQPEGSLQVVYVPGIAGSIGKLDYYQVMVKYGDQFPYFAEVESEDAAIEAIREVGEINKKGVKK